MEDGLKQGMISTSSWSRILPCLKQGTATRVARGHEAVGEHHTWTASAHTTGVNRSRPTRFLLPTCECGRALVLGADLRIVLHT